MITKDKLHQAYVVDQLSIRKVADLFFTTPTIIRNKLIEYNIPLRSQSEAQKIALSQKRREHPTAGKTRPEKTKKKISNNIHKYWSNLSEKDLTTRLQNTRNLWVNLSDEERKIIQAKSAKGLREAVAKGSKLERYIYKRLVEENNHVLFHKDGLEHGENLETDLYIVNKKIVIEIDGIFHTEVVFSEEKLDSQKRSDQLKNNLLISKGIWVLRVQNNFHDFSKANGEKTFQLIKEKINQIEDQQGKNMPPRVFYLNIRGVKNDNS